MSRFHRALAFSAFAATLVISGCNVFDAAYDEGGSVENLVDDARYARANGDFERAVALLEDAYEQDASNPIVRVELATTLMQREGLNSVDLLGQVSDYVTGAVESTAGGGRFGSTVDFGARSSAEACSYTSGETDREVFDPAGFEGYADITASLDLFRRVRGLLAGTDGSVLPAALLDASPCEQIVDGEVVYDHEAALDELYETFDNDGTLVRTALQLNAIVLTLDAYTGIFEQSDLPVDWYLVGSEDNKRLGFCAPDTETLDLLYGRIDSQVGDVGRALFSIDLLVYDAPSETLEDLRDEALELYMTFEEDISRYCD